MRRVILFLSCLFIAIILCGCDGHTYEEAVRLMEQGEYEEAMVEFESLGEYEDAEMLLKECRYELAVSAMEREDWDAAIGYFEDMDIYDSAELLEECVKEKGMRENADYDFLSALEKSVLDRIDSASSDESESGDYNKYLSSLVDKELAYLLEFDVAQFYDKNLGDLADQYLEGLRVQADSFDEEYLSEQNYEWQRGLVMRCDALTKLYEDYGFLAGNQEFIALYVLDGEEQAKILNAMDEIYEDIQAQYSDEDFHFRTSGSEVYAVLQNNTQYRFSIEANVEIADKNYVVLERVYGYADNIVPGSTYRLSVYTSYPDDIRNVNWDNVVYNISFPEQTDF